MILISIEKITISTYIIKGGNYMNPTKWVKDRADERTSWDGAVLILIGVVVLIAGPFAKLAAWAAMGYGAWTLWKKEK